MKVKFFVEIRDGRYYASGDNLPVEVIISHPDILMQLAGTKIGDSHWIYQIKEEWFPALFGDEEYEEYKRVFLYPRLLREKNSLPRHHKETALYKDKCDVICPICSGEMAQGEPMTVRLSQPNEQTVNTKTCSCCGNTQCEQATI